MFPQNTDKHLFQFFILQDYSVYYYKQDAKGSKSIKGDVNQSSPVRRFSIDEELFPESGKTYGSYGHIDKKGDLHYVEYTKNKD